MILAGNSDNGIVILTNLPVEWELSMFDQNDWCIPLYIYKISS